MKPKGALIVGVRPDSIAEEMSVQPGDRLLTINGQVLQDLIDYRYLSADDELEVEIIKPSGEVWVLDVEKDPDEELGLEFAEATFDGIKRCRNKCIFCFVDQMPPGLRESLYIKDDDYRMSFLHGNFVTFTNLSGNDLDRLLQLRLSPLYVSVHTTNPELRQTMLSNRRAGDVLGQLAVLAGAGIHLHTQIVVCPGINDGPELARTLEDLGKLFPAVRSIAVVPVGLTGFREGLPTLRLYTPKEASQVLELVDQYREQFAQRLCTALAYCADEFFLLAGRPIPSAEYYEEFPQTENGVGLTRLFLDSFARNFPLLPASLQRDVRLVLVTGRSAQKILAAVAEQLNQVGRLEVNLVGVNNTFFGETVTVAGLLTGGDISRSLKQYLAEDSADQTKPIVCIPSVMLKAGEETFLDGTTISDLRQQLRCPVEVIDLENQADGLIDKIRELGLGVKS